MTSSDRRHWRLVEDIETGDVDGVSCACERGATHREEGDLMAVFEEANKFDEPASWLRDARRDHGEQG